MLRGDRPSSVFVLAALLGIVPGSSALVLCTLRDGSRFIGDTPPAGCTAEMTLSDEAPSSVATGHDDDLSRAAAAGRELMHQRAAARKKDEARGNAISVLRDNHGRIKRSSSARKRFLIARGLTRTPPGCQVDHVVPLAKGGADVPANMQLLCGEELREKEATELR